MNTKLTLTIGLLSTMLTAAPLTAFADEHNLLQDPGFELRLAPSDGGWTLFEQSVFSKDQARSGSQSMFSGAFSRTVAFPPYFVGNVAGSFQELTASPGSRWRLTGYGMTPTGLKGTPAFGIVQLTFFDEYGNELGTVETTGQPTPAKTSNEINSKTAAGEWTFLDTGIATAPESAAAVQAFTIYVDYSGANTAQGVFFDDLTLCVLGDDGDGSSGGCGG